MDHLLLIMKILVTGAAGFIGSHTAERLADAGYRVTGIDNFSDYYDLALKKDNQRILEEKHVTILQDDLNEGLAGFEPGFDYIFHFAAQPGIDAKVSFDTYAENNINATNKLLNFALKNRQLKMFVNISTSSVYGLNATGREDTVPEPASFYGVTKLAAEQLVLQYARSGILPACSLRLYSVYGPRERPDKLFTKLIDSVFSQKPFPLYKGSEKHIRSFTYVQDIVDGVISVIGKEAACNGQVINLGNETGHTTQYGIDCIKEITGKDIVFETLPGRKGDQLHTRADISKARLLLGYSPATSLLNGLCEQVAHHQRYFKQPATGS